MKKHQLSSIGAKWRKQANKIKEYEKIVNEKLDYTDFISPYTSPDELHQGELLKRTLLKQYKGRSFEDVFAGRIKETPKGPCFHLVNTETIKLAKPDQDTARSRILPCLKLLYGIGDFRQQRLTASGYCTLMDLLKHPGYCTEAGEIIRMLDAADTRGLMEIIHRWFPKSDPLVLALSGFHELEDFVFFDIETMGLYTRPIILFGIASFRKDVLTINQYLVRAISDESAALMATLSHITPRSVLVTYNGKAFDVPYLKERAAFYRIRTQLDHLHFDLLHFVRRAWGATLPDCALTTVEREIVKDTRSDDVPSALVPDFYATYLREDNPGPLVPIVDHNRRDVITLTRIIASLWDFWK